MRHRIGEKGPSAAGGRGQQVSNSDARMAEFDNTQKIAPFLDKHLLLMLLDHTLEQKVSSRVSWSMHVTHVVCMEYNITLTGLITEYSCVQWYEYCVCILVNHYRHN